MNNKLTDFLLIALAVIVIAFVVFLLAGCSNSGTPATIKSKDEVVKPNMTVYGMDDTHFCYAVDETTGVVYMMFTRGVGDYRTAGITPVYDANGSVMTKWQFGLTRGDFE